MMPRFLASLLLTTSLATAAAAADPPAPGTIPRPGLVTMPPVLRLVGTEAGQPDRERGRFPIEVRDQANNPLNGAPVVVDFSGCPDLAICQSQGDPDMVVNCASKTVRLFTNVLGQVVFTIAGSGLDGAPSSSANAGKVFAGGVLVGTPTVAAFDLDGQSGLGIHDLTVWLQDFGTQPWAARGDFDGNGTLGINDLSVWLEAWGAGHQIESCAVACP